jgi:two-component system chemotaxis response regulator CheY
MLEEDCAVLIIDDFATMTRILKSIVNALGYSDVDCCQSGDDGLSQLTRRAYGLIICDLEMSPMTGAEFATKARARPYMVNCPIIITSASRGAAAQFVRDGVHEFVDAFIFKPFTAADLKAKISEISENRRAMQRRLGP